MSLNQHIIDQYQDNIKDLPNQVIGQAAWLKAKFDGRGDKELKNSINGIIAEILAESPLRASAKMVGESLWVTSSEARPTDSYNVQFDAPADYVRGQGLVIDGRPVALQDMTGQPPGTGWVAGAAVLIARRGSVAWLVGGGGGAGAVHLSDRAPDSGDDARAGFALGSLWLEQGPVENLIIPSAFLAAGMWQVENGAQVSRTHDTLDYFAPASTGEGVCTATLSMPELDFQKGHVYYTRYQTNTKYGLEAESKISWVESSPGGGEALAVALPGEDGFRVLDGWMNGEDLQLARLRIATAKNYRSYGIALSQPLLVDLTDTFGPGQEWSLERCREFFAKYPGGGGMVGKGLYMCVMNDAGAAIWRRLAFSDELQDITWAVERAVTAAQGATAAAAGAMAAAGEAQGAAADAGEAAGAAADAAQMALDEAQRIVAEGLVVLDPVSLLRVPVEVALMNNYLLHLEEGALTADEYDALGLTADAYDAYGLTATRYDTQSKKILGG